MRLGAFKLTPPIGVMNSNLLPKTVNGTPPAARFYHRPAQEAQRLSVSPRTFASWLAKKRVPFRKVGRAILLCPDEVDRALEKFRVGPRTEPKRRASRTAEVQS